nr:hypothetical protein [Archangium violaceum]
MTSSQPLCPGSSRAAAPMKLFNVRRLWVSRSRVRSGPTARAWACIAAPILVTSECSMNRRPSMNSALGAERCG